MKRNWSIKEKEKLVLSIVILENEIKVALKVVNAKAAEGAAAVQEAEIVIIAEEATVALEVVTAKIVEGVLVLVEKQLVAYLHFEEKARFQMPKLSP